MSDSKTSSSSSSWLSNLQSASPWLVAIGAGAVGALAGIGAYYGYTVGYKRHIVGAREAKRVAELVRTNFAESKSKILTFVMTIPHNRYDMTKLTRIFNHFELLLPDNRVGLLTRESWTIITTQIGIRGAALRNGLFDLFDANGDGVIDFVEFIASLNVMCGLRTIATDRERMRRYFRMYTSPAYHTTAPISSATPQPKSSEPVLTEPIMLVMWSELMRDSAGGLGFDEKIYRLFSDGPAAGGGPVTFAWPEDNKAGNKEEDDIEIDGAQTGATLPPPTSSASTSTSASTSSSPSSGPITSLQEEAFLSWALSPSIDLGAVLRSGGSFERWIGYLFGAIDAPFDVKQIMFRHKYGAAARF